MLFGDENRLAESADAERPMAACSSQRLGILEKPRESAAVSLTQHASQPAYNLDRDPAPGDDEARCQRQEAQDRSLGEGVDVTMRPSESVCVAQKALAPLTRLKYTDAGRLLNGTPLGTVVNDRQLRRHRERSGGVFCSGRRLNLPAYIAWLIDQRHRPERTQMQGRISLDRLRTLLAKQDHRCALTGRVLTPSTLSLDHIMPVSQGGGHVIENAQFLDKEVNRAKGALTNEKFIALCREVAAWADKNGTDE